MVRRANLVDIMTAASAGKSGTKKTRSKAVKNLAPRVSEILSPALVQEKIKRPIKGRIPSAIKSAHPNADFEVTHFTLCRTLNNEKWFKILSRAEGLKYLNDAIKNNIVYDIERTHPNYITIFEHTAENLKPSQTKKSRTVSLSKEMRSAASLSGLDAVDWANATLEKSAHIVTAGELEILRIQLQETVYDSLLGVTGSKAGLHEWLSTCIVYGVQGGRVQNLKVKHLKVDDSPTIKVGVKIPDYVFASISDSAKNVGMSRNSLAQTIVMDLLERSGTFPELFPAHP